jgi:hypothetical protein
MPLAKGGFLYLLGDLNDEGLVVGAIVTPAPLGEAKLGGMSIYSASGEMMITHIRRLLAEVLHRYGGGVLCKNSHEVRNLLNEAFSRLCQADILIRPGLQERIEVRNKALYDGAREFDAELERMRQKLDDLVNLARGG